MFNMENDSKNELNVYMDTGVLVKDIQELMNLSLDGVCMTRLVTGECPWNPKLKTIDMKLDVFGP